MALAQRWAGSYPGCALVTIGRLADEQVIANIANPHWWAGTNEVKLARAARHFDCDLPMVRRTDEERARRALVRHVDQQRGRNSRAQRSRRNLWAAQQVL